MVETPTELQAQLAKIGEEEALLQSKLQLLAEKRRSILRKLDAVVYPVSTLPSDIMAEISMHYVDTLFMEFSSFSMNPRLDSPLRLASVCSTWRRVALSFPRLWAALRLSWCPLSVTRPHGPDLTPAISDAIAHYAPQLRSLTLGPRLVGQLSQLCFPVLEALEMWGDQWEFNVIVFIGEAPQLREVSFCGGSPSLAKLPWNQITSLDLRYCAAPTLEVLKQAPNLKMLKFTADDEDEEDSDDAQALVPIVMTKLHSLIFHPWSTSSNCSIFGHLAIPAL
ncbi:hypothetical protein C8J57DRAFT_1720395 [Mycena rebaudengoi]|nr:hypothetical protein C8J57DRAFT_1720395 [Mycena rebaudengoi]